MNNLYFTYKMPLYMSLKLKSDVEKFITLNFLNKTKLVHMAHQLTCTAELAYQ